MTPCVVLVERSMWEPWNSLDDDVLFAFSDNLHDLSQ